MPLKKESSKKTVSQKQTVAIAPSKAKKQMIKLLLIILLTVPFFNASAYNNNLTDYDLFEYERDRQFEKDMEEIEKRIKKQNLKWERERDLESEKIHRRRNRSLQLNDDYDD